MRCQNCGEAESSVLLKQVIGGKKEELHLCAACAAQHGLAIDPKSIISQALSGKHAPDWVAMATEFMKLHEEVLGKLPAMEHWSVEDFKKALESLKDEQATEAQQSATEALAEKLAQLPEAGTPAKARRRRKVATPACPACGFTLQDFKKNRRFGCAEDYEVFAPQVREMLTSIHGAAEHRGRQPTRMAATQARTRHIAALKSELESAIKGEEFERAATLRDKLRLIEEGGDSDAGAS